MKQWQKFCKPPGLSLLKVLSLSWTFCIWIFAYLIQTYKSLLLIFIPIYPQYQEIQPVASDNILIDAFLLINSVSVPKQQRGGISVKWLFIYITLSLIFLLHNIYSDMLWCNLDESPLDCFSGYCIGWLLCWSLGKVEALEHMTWVIFPFNLS